ncbi:hypothetical protein CAter282_4539 [Collimonas arenae]|uniref:Uncharacterized protein n=1 Tax=Collimonas arenae TaxID=279058 RepID=A0A127QQX3_9BURK|nr:hypothetical protein CAter10_4939 [Collimonas arenae]AMP12195.1 hypothetical protein CAter282_4539 [Collimonas arenae]
MLPKIAEIIFFDTALRRLMDIKSLLSLAIMNYSTSNN